MIFVIMRGNQMFIRDIVARLPKQRVDNSTIASWCNSDETLLSEKIGILYRHFLDNDENEISLAYEACSKLFELNPLLRNNNVKLLIFVGQTKTQIIPHSSAVLHHKLSLAHDCMAFDIGLACSGYVYALSVIKSFMNSSNIQDAILVTCDPYSLIMGKANRDTVPLFGDAATASWLSMNGPGIKIGQFDLGTDGSRASFLECKKDSELMMNGRGIFNFVIQQVPDSIHKCLDLNGKNIKDINYFFLHQANKFILEQLILKLGISPSVCPICMQDTANTVSSSLPVLIEKFMKGFSSGESIILSGFGGGLSWGTVYGEYLE